MMRPPSRRLLCLGRCGCEERQPATPEEMQAGMAVALKNRDHPSSSCVKEQVIHPLSPLAREVLHPFRAECFLTWTKDEPIFIGMLDAHQHFFVIWTSRSRY